MAGPYDVGDKVRLSAAFTDENEVATDPTTVTVRYRKPDESTVVKVHVTDAEVVKDSTGNYHIDISVDAAGKWFYRWEGTGTLEAAGDASFVALDPGVS